MVIEEDTVWFSNVPLNVFLIEFYWDKAALELLAASFALTKKLPIAEPNFTEIRSTFPILPLVVVAARALRILGKML